MKFTNKEIGNYLIWVAVNLAALFISGNPVFGGDYDYHNHFYPFDGFENINDYDTSEFLAYTVVPFVIILAIKLRKADKRSVNSKPNQSNGHNNSQQKPVRKDNSKKKRKLKKGFGWFFCILGVLNIFRGLTMFEYDMYGETYIGWFIFWAIGFIVLGVWMINTSKPKEQKESSHNSNSSLNDIENVPKENAQPQNLYEQLLPTATTIVINGYRRIAAERNIAPTSKTSDEKIIEIYRLVGETFNGAAQQKGEHIPAKYLNTIMLKFYQVYEFGGDIMLEEHLQYEVDKYMREGLRNEYKQELELF